MVDDLLIIKPANDRRNDRVVGGGPIIDFYQVCVYCDQVLP